jgi:hypothetical protein
MEMDHRIQMDALEDLQKGFLAKYENTKKYKFGI